MGHDKNAAAKLRIHRTLDSLIFSIGGFGEAPWGAFLPTTGLAGNPNLMK
jgi:hypothetical protein